MKPVYSNPIAATLFALLVAACHGGDDGPTPDAGTPTPDAGMTAPDAMPAPEPELVVSTIALSVEEGGAGATFTVRLSEAPAGEVQVSLASADPGAVGAEPTSLSFGTQDFDVDQTVTVTAVDDANAAAEQVAVTLSAAGLDDATVTVTTIDDDTLGIEVEPASVTVDEGASISFNVRLSAQPTAALSVTVASSDDGAASVDLEELTFTPADYDQPQTVTVSGIDDADVVDESVTLTLSATGVADAEVAVAVTDEDTQTLVVSETDLSVDEGASATFTVALSNDPLGTLEVTIASSDSGAASAAPATLSFDSSNFDQVQTMTVTGEADDDSDNEAVTLTLSAAGVADTAVSVAVTDTTPVYPVAMFVRGSFNDFGTDDELLYEGNSLYTAVIPLDVGAHAFKIADGAFSDAMTFSISILSEVEIQLDTPTALESAPGLGNNTLLNLTAQGRYLFELDASDPNAPVLTVSLAEPAPFAEDMFIFHDPTHPPDPEDKLLFEDITRYTARIPLPETTIGFVVSNADVTAGFTADNDNPVTIEFGVPMPLEPLVTFFTGTGLPLTRPGVYLFDLDTTDPAVPVVTVTQDELFVRGSFNSFAPVAPLVFNAGTRYLAEVFIEAGAHEFKIADATFADTSTFAADSTDPVAVELNTPLALLPAPGVGNNLVLDAPLSGAYLFELDMSVPEAPVLTVGLITP
ncbi:hypothetical protein [Haliangium sp.]|uniref:hypothetical protein n=1 Tax=Haliangium sp. TaxID=2663208 RepID=UPI003D0B018E